MADKYLRSTTGSDANDGNSWATAWATLKFAMETAAAGDTIFVSQAHAETPAVTVTTITGLGTVVSPQRILCVNDSTGALTTGATITTTGGNDVTFAGSFYMEGLAFNTGSGTSDGFTGWAFGTAACVQVLKNCALRLGGNNASCRITIGPTTSGSNLGREVRFVDCVYRFVNSGQGFAIRAPFYVDGGSIESGSTALSGSGLCAGFERTPAIVVFRGVDLTNLGNSGNLAGPGSVGNPPCVDIRFINCKMPASWAGGAFSGTPQVGSRLIAANCDGGDTNYRIVVQDYTGTLTSETTVVRTGGASDGATPISWRMTPDSSVNFPLEVLRSLDITAWNETTGTPRTATVEIITDGVTLNDDEAWLEIMHLGTSGFPLGSIISDCKANVLATAAAQTSSTAAWTTTGLASPVKQRLSVTFTPQEKGLIVARVCLARPSTTVFVCPKLTIT